MPQNISVIINEMSFSDPAIPGTNVTFSCPSGQVLTGPNKSTCMENGEWNIDLRSLRCIGNFSFDSGTVLYIVPTEHKSYIAYID